MTVARFPLAVRGRPHAWQGTSNPAYPAKCVRCNYPPTHALHAYHAAAAIGRFIYRWMGR